MAEQIVEGQDEIEELLGWKATAIKIPEVAEVKTEPTEESGRGKDDSQEELEKKLYELENLSRLQREAEEGGYGCLRCRHTGWVVVFGKETPCSCQMAAKASKDKKKPKPTKINVQAELASSERAVLEGVIPKNRAKDEFDSEMAQIKIETLAQASSAMGCLNKDEYLKTLNNILVAVTNGTLDRSYILGAPIGCSKTTFVMTCLKRLVNADKKCAPYLSLTELAAIQKESLRAIGGKQPSGSAEKPEAAEKFKWKDFLEADVLFTYLTNYEAAVTELSILKSILYQRGITGKPTIVMTSSSIRLYESNDMLKSMFWSDICLYDRSIKTVKRLLHCSTWFKYPRRQAPGIKARAGEDF